MRRRVAAISLSLSLVRGPGRGPGRDHRALLCVHHRLMSAQSRGRSGYEAFGSFHTPSPAELFAQPPDAAARMADANTDADAYASTFLPPPPQDSQPRLVFPPADADAATAARALAHNRALFTIDFTHWTYLNHGAFGGPLRYARQVADAWRTHADEQPLRFYDRELFPLVVRAIQALARVLNVSAPQELVLLPNATAGLHAVLASVLTAPDAPRSVMCFSTRYGAVHKMLQLIRADAVDRVGGVGGVDGVGEPRLRIHEEPLSYAESLDDEAVLRRLDHALDQLEPHSLVVVDHITSNTGVVLPVAQIVARCHARGMVVLVDGAHGLLNLALDLDQLNADYYVGNCHKWMATTRGAAFLHVNRHSGLPQTRTTVVAPRVASHGVLDGFQSAFMWIGLQDYSAWLSLPRCLAFWDHQGVARCRGYMHQLVQDATELLYRQWGMPLALAEAQRLPIHKRHAMRLVRLPSRTMFGVAVNSESGGAAGSGHGAAGREHGVNTSADAKHIQDTLHERHAIEVPVKCVDGWLHVRISGHVYNALNDYQTLADAILAPEPAA